MLKQLKHEIKNGLGTDFQRRDFLSEFYAMKKRLKLTGDYFDTNSLWVHGKPCKLIQIEGIKFFIQIASGTYRVVGLPLAETKKELLRATQTCLDLGLRMEIDKQDLQELHNTNNPQTITDNYTYHFEDLEDYWDKEASKQSKKIHRKLERDYNTSLISASDVTPTLFNAIEHINKVWLETFKENDKKYRATLSYVMNMQKFRVNWENLHYIIYTNKETNTIEAYDYIEAWGNIGIASAGKAIIPKVSTFKHVTINLVRFLKEVGADHCILGSSTMYNLDMTLKDEKSVIKGLQSSKRSIPHRTTYLYVYPFNIKKFQSIDISPPKPSDLF